MAEGRFVPAASAGPDPVALLFRHVLDERRRALFPPGGRVLEIRSAAPQAGGAFDAAVSPPGALDGVDVPGLATWLAGTVYESVAGPRDRVAAFHALVLAGAACLSLGGLIIPLLPTDRSRLRVGESAGD